MKRLIIIFFGALGLGLPVQAALSITPSAATLSNSQTVTLSVAGADASGVHWSTNSTTGLLVATGSTAVYTVPSALQQNQAVTIQVSSVSNPSQIAKTVLSLVPLISVSITPGLADLYPGFQTVFHATVQGTPNTAVQWSVSPSGVGTIDSNGLYSAPNHIATPATATIIAAAQADKSKTASFPVRLHGTDIYFTTNANGLQSVVFNGTDYNFVYGEGLLTSVAMQAPGSPAVVYYAPNCTSSFTVNTVTKNCTAGSDNVVLQVVYSTPTPSTVRADMLLTNNSRTNTISTSMISTLGVKMAQFDPKESVVNGLAENVSPLSYGSFVSGRFGVWTDTPGPNVKMNQACGWNIICKNQPELLNIPPGKSASAAFSLRLSTDLTQSLVDFAPEAYAAYRNAYPPILNWPDRRPIMAWFMSDHSHQSATNPRGYLNDPTIDISNPTKFQSAMLTQAQNILSSIKSRPVQPQGIILWDIEGQEFIQPTTYVGDPRVFAEGYAPEMNSAADQVMTLFKNAGLKVGITLRPNYLQWGPKASLPTTCHYDPNNDLKDYFIGVDAGFQKNFYACYGTNTWSIIPSGNGGQTIYQPSQVQQVIDLLMSKVNYARARWGTTLYYVDSTVWTGGAPISASIFRALQQAFPDSLFIPEESYTGTMAAAMPYSASNLSSASKFGPVTWRYAYPNAADAVNLSNCAGSCWTTNMAAFDTGQKIGDIALYSIPQQLSNSHLTEIETMIQNARREAGTVIVTDSSTGAAKTYTGTPATVSTYPVKMRVYFAASPAALPASSTYCENGSWLGTNSCTLNVAGLGASQVRYYDFQGNLVSSEPPAGH